MASSKNYQLCYGDFVAKNNGELTERIRVALKNYYGTSVVKRVSVHSGIPEARVRNVFYRRLGLKGFDLAVLLLCYDFLRAPLGLARIPEEILNSGNKKREERRKNLLDIIANNPGLSARDLSGVLGIGVKAAEYRLSCLKKSGMLARKGANKNGKWVVIGKY